MEYASRGLQYVGVEMATDENLCDLHYGGDPVCLFRSVEDNQIALNKLAEVVALFDMYFVSSKYRRYKTGGQYLLI